MLVLALSLTSLTSILMVVLGLGMVIFFHELGHFAVAKWCGVKVERFSIGFGPILWSRWWGETEYALSAIPFGGYVKMLGQDDMDPGQETNTDVAENPRSYTSKNVPQRMAIISAGVIMNVITGMLFFVLAFRMGHLVPAAEIGFVQPGMPAYKAGLRPDDELIAMNGRPLANFADINRATALSRGPIRVVGRHADGETFDVVIHPDESGTKRMIGVAPQSSLKVIPLIEGKEIPVALPGTPAAMAKPGFEHGDRIKTINGEPVTSYAELRVMMARLRGETVTFGVARGKSSELHEIVVSPQPAQTLGINMKMGRIAAVQEGSPAAKAGIRPGDKLLKVQSSDDEEPLVIPGDLKSERVADWFADHAGQQVTVEVQRENEGPAESRSITLTPQDRRNWAATPLKGAPMEIPAIGAAFHFLPSIESVDPGSAAAKEKITTADRIIQVEFLRPEDWPAMLHQNDITVAISEKNEANWTYVHWLIQNQPNWDVRLTLKPKGEGKLRQVTLKPVPVENRYLASDRGLLTQGLMVERKANSVAEAVQMGWHQTRNDISDIYLTIRGLFSGSISTQELQGPIGIFSIGVDVASQGWPTFLIFLGYLSVNLAVINFLPIPVLDGGHMVFLIWEGIARKRPSERVYVTAMYLGMMFVLGLMMYVIYLDLARRVA